MIEIIEVAPNTYKTPAIDGRRRKSYAMFQMVMGYTDFRTETLRKLDGTTSRIEFETYGWREVA